jgi:hypothetical protein
MLKDSIKKYCEELAKSDVDFATHYNPDKLSACCNYITNQARKLAKGNCACVEDSVVYKWARDFFYGDTEEFVVSQEETSDEDEEILDEEEIETKPATVITTKKEKKSDEQYQMSLF